MSECNTCKGLLVIPLIDELIAPCPACKAIPYPPVNSNCALCSGNGVVDNKPCKKCYPAYESCEYFCEQDKVRKPRRIDMRPRISKANNGSWDFKWMHKEGYFLAGFGPSFKSIIRWAKWWLFEGLVKGE